MTWREHSFLISEGRGYGLAIWAACVAGAGLAALRGQRPMQRAAIGFLAFLALQQLIFLLNVLVGFSWRGPSAAYLDMFALPFYGPVRGLSLARVLVRNAGATGPSDRGLELGSLGDRAAQPARSPLRSRFPRAEPVRVAAA